MKIVIYDPVGFDESQIASIRDAAGDIDVVVSNKEQLAAELEQAEIFSGSILRRCFSRPRICVGFK